MPRLSIIMPCYFNEKNIPVTKKALLDNEALFPADVLFEYVMVDDGSKDKTLDELLKFKEEHPEKVKVIKLSGNFGSYNAILAGMNFASGDCLAILTADLQDPPELLAKMYRHWEHGVKLVIANRRDREESLLHRFFSNAYHFLIRKMALKNIPPGGYDLVLFDKQLKDEVVKINEKNTNQLYLLSWLNYEYVSIPYTRKKREIGKSRWTLKKKIKLFVDSFVSFSFFPIRMISIVGLLLGSVSLLYAIFVVYAKLTGLVPLQGWTTLMVVLLFVSSFQMIALGIIGEYVWRALDAARNRPNFIVDRIW